jgi:hypothetical protein
VPSSPRAPYPAIGLPRSTLAARQLPWERLAAAALTALAGLKARRLAALQPPEEPGGANKWGAAPLGRVVYHSTLPPVRQGLGSAAAGRGLAGPGDLLGAAAGGGVSGSRQGVCGFSCTQITLGPPTLARPQAEALVLHERLAALRPNAVLGTSAHLLFALLLEPPFAIFEWKAYCDLLRCLGPDHR